MHLLTFVELGVHYYLQHLQEFKEGKWWTRKKTVSSVLTKKLEKCDTTLTH